MQYKFQLISDIHLECGTYYNITPRAPYLLLAGDIGYPESRIFQDFMKQCSKKFEKVFYTAGNHEYYQIKHKKSIEDLEVIIRDICKEYDNVYYLQNSSYEFSNLTIVGSTLWSDVKDSDELVNDYSKIYKEGEELITISDTIEMHHESKAYIESVIESSYKPILVMTHHLPSYQMILPAFASSAYKSHFASDLDYLFKSPVITWVCGHSHGYNKQMINEIPCIMNGIGYPSEQRRGASLNYVFALDV